MRALRSSPRAAFAVCMLALGAYAAAAPRTSAGAARAQRDFDWNGEMAPGATLRVFSIEGDVTVREGSGRTARIRAVTRPGERGGEIEYVTGRDGGDVRVCAVRDGATCTDEGVRNRNSWGGGRRARADFTVELPRGVALRVGTGNGEVEVGGATAGVRAASGNGDVRVGAGAERVDASSGNGAVTVDGARGPVEASTGNGRVTVSTARGPVAASSGNGNIEVRMDRLDDRGDLRFSSGNGNVTLTLPADFSAELDASSGNGRVESDFPVRVQGRVSGQRMRGTIGDGGRALRISTGNGRITLRRGG